MRTTTAGADNGSARRQVPDGVAKPRGKDKVPVALPDGTYYGKVTLLKALGKKADGDTETWTSPSFIIDRP